MGQFPVADIGRIHGQFNRHGCTVDEQFTAGVRSCGATPPEVRIGGTARRRGHFGVVVFTVKGDCHGQFLEVGRALDDAGFFASRIQCRQEHRGQDRDDGNHNEEFNESENLFSFIHGHDSFSVSYDP